MWFTLMGVSLCSDYLSMHLEMQYGPRIFRDIRRAFSRGLCQEYQEVHRLHPISIYSTDIQYTCYASHHPSICHFLHRRSSEVPWQIGIIRSYITNSNQHIGE